MSLKDILKKSVYDQYLSANAEITVEILLLTLVIVALLALLMLAVYKITYKGAIFSAGFSASMLLTAMVTSLVILPISSNLTLSLGMVGALSIVRYRTAVKDPKDIAYMFWAIGIGLTCGAGFYLIAIAGTAFISIVMLALLLVSNRKAAAEPCIAVFRLTLEGNLDEVKKLFPKLNVKSLTINDDFMEMTAEIGALPGNGTLEKLKKNPQLINMSFVKYNGDYAV